MLVDLHESKNAAGLMLPTYFPTVNKTKNVEKFSGHYVQLAERTYATKDSGHIMDTLGILNTEKDSEKLQKTKLAVLIGAFQNLNLSMYNLRLVWNSSALAWHTTILYQLGINFDLTALEALTRSATWLLDGREKGEGDTSLAKAVGGYPFWDKNNCHIFAEIVTNLDSIETFNNNPAIPDEIKVLVNLTSP